MIKERITMIFILMAFPLACFTQGIDTDILKKLTEGKVKIPTQITPADSLKSKQIKIPKEDTLSAIEKMFKEKYMVTSRRMKLEQIKDSLTEQIRDESLKVELAMIRKDTLFFPDTSYLSLRKNLFKVNKQLDSSFVTLRQFGYDMFQTSLYDIPTFAPVAENYILGPGDELSIVISGELNNSWMESINREGAIVLPYIGSINLWGKTYAESKYLIKEAFSKEFSNIDVTVSLGNLKSVNVFILGEVNKPGIYSTTVLSNPLASLFEAGGPKKSGSLRNIKYISSKGNSKNIDLYTLLVKKRPLPAIQFSSGDILFVPPIEDVAGISGAINRPGIYELKDNERLSELIEMAGKSLPTAGKKRIQLERISPDNEKIVKDLKFEDQADFHRIAKNVKIENGDLVRVFEIPPYLHNYVEIVGNVKNEGTFGLKDGMTVLDLINEAGGIRKGTYIKRAEILRFAGVTYPKIIEINLEKLLDGSTEDNIKLVEWDRLTIFSNENLEEKFFVEISGEVEKPDSYPLHPQMRIMDLLFLARTKISAQDEAELFRIDQDKGAYVEKINIKNEEDLNIPLQPRDYILIKRNPYYREVGTVNLKGEFNFPGNYQIKVGTPLKELIDRAGGFTENAYLEGAIFSRVSVAEAQNQAIADLTTETRMRLLYEQRTLMSSMQSEADKLANMEYIRIQQQQLSSIMARSKKKGRIVINLLDPEQINMPLENADTIYVPLLPKTVQIIGEVYNPTGIAYKDGLSLNDYLAMAGGPKPSADRKEIYVRRASGKVEKGTTKIKPGDTIVVPVKVKVGVSFWQVLGNTVDIVYKVALAVLAFNAIK